MLIINCVVSRFSLIFTQTATVVWVLSSLFILSSAFFCDCPDNSRKANVLMNTDRLKESKMFSDFSDAPICTSPGNTCECIDYCKIQLRNAPVSNMVPTCVKLTNGSLVCQCLIAIPNENDPGKCPSNSLQLISNMMYNMSGVSKFFGIDVPICGTLHSSINFYKGSGPEQKNTAKPFIKYDGLDVNKVGVQFSTAQNIGGFYIVYYLEFVITCKTNISFISDDLKLCPQKECNTEKPFVKILMDLSGTGLDDPDNKVFKRLDSQITCVTNAANQPNQCLAESSSSCNKETEPCCYSKNCIFPFVPEKDICPCPPEPSNLILAVDIKLACNAKNIIFLFDEPNPPLDLGFVWDLESDLLNGDIEECTKMLVGRGTMKSTEANEEDTIFWFGEFVFNPFAFCGCLTEILDNLDSNKVPPFLKLINCDGVK